jgi:hypothetical protein
VVTVGLHPAQVREHMRGCREAARIDNDAGIENDESGRPVMICAGPRRSWSREWPSLRRYG